MKNNNLGILYAFVGVTILSFDSVLVHLIGSAPWDLVFWRGVLLAITMFLITTVTGGKKRRKTPIAYCTIDLIGGCAFALSTSFFVLSINRTDAASTLAIFNTAPFFAAVIAFFTLKERLEKHTITAMIASILGVGIIFFHGATSGQVTGDYDALAAAVCSAVYLVCLRKRQGNNSHNVLITGGLVMASIALLNGANPASLNGTQFMFIALLGCIVVPFSGLFIAQSSKYLPAAQTALILLLELLLGPLWILLVLGIVPERENLIGGTIVLISLVLHSLWERKLKHLNQAQVLSQD
ncbi:DMT family transporter (plasmid) [Vibrio pelagius]|uniref:DMT family transporter n=1 Tax=Vibrio pelagius TaxID=28169 RepID=A0ABY5GB10_VIBPE|nr:DMT family transporter [Vibrio pelagius]UTT87301.1 DMT family transporter [Vibrio pelagius]